MKKFSAWRGRKFSLATQKYRAIFDKYECSNKILQNKQRYKTTISCLPLAIGEAANTPPQRHPNHTSFKKIKDVSDERRRITRLTLFNLLTLTLSSSSLQGIVCKHPLLLSRSSVRHSSSKLDSALAQSQISASHRKSGTVKKPILMKTTGVGAAKKIFLIKIEGSGAAK